MAVESGFYDLDLQDEDPKAVEGVLADVEGVTAEVLRRIDQTMEAPLQGSADRDALSIYLALQMTRTPEQRERLAFPEDLAQFLNGRELTRDLVAEYLEHHHLGFAPRPGEIEGAWTYATVALSHPSINVPELSMRIMLSAVGRVAPSLSSLHWCLEHDRKHRFMTSDSPLVLWKPPSPRDSFEGIGIETATEIRFPLDPAKQLVLSRTKRSASARVNPSRVLACNQDLAFGCHKFVVASPGDASRLDSLELPRKRPILRFNTGPLMRRSQTGKTVEDGEVLHTWVPRR